LFINLEALSKKVFSKSHANMAHTDVKAFEEELELLTKVIAILGDLLFFLFNRTFPNILITSFLYVIIE
jgi:hypothetical protein